MLCGSGPNHDQVDGDDEFDSPQLLNQFSETGNNEFSSDITTDDQGNISLTISFEL